MMSLSADWNLNLWIKMKSGWNKIVGTDPFLACSRGLTKKAEPPPTRGVNRDSGTASANGGWLRRLVRRHRQHHAKWPVKARTKSETHKTAPNIQDTTAGTYRPQNLGTNVRITTTTAATATRLNSPAVSQKCLAYRIEINATPK